MKNRYKLADGQLSRYALYCGYWQVFPTDTKARNAVTLWHEGACFHVRQCNHAASGTESFRVFWDSFENLTDARKRFAQAKRDIKNAA